jgi:hypothetical protein
MRIQSDSLGVITDRHVEIHLFGMGASPIAVSLGIIWTDPNRLRVVFYRCEIVAPVTPVAVPFWTEKK